MLISCFFGFVIAFFGVFILIYPEPEPEVAVPDVHRSEVSRIAELATSRNYYHNIIQLRSDPSGIFKYGWFRLGYQRYWAEYDGIVEVGVDASKITISEPDHNGVVQIYVPQAKVLSVNADNDSIIKRVEASGLFDDVTLEEKNEAFDVAQMKMRLTAANDESMLLEAREKAKHLILEFYNNVSEATGAQYQIEFVDQEGES